MFVSTLGVDQQWADDVAHAIRNENGRSHKTLLRVPGHIRHADGDDKRHDTAERSGDGVSYDGSSGSVGPLGLPDHGTAGDDGTAAYDEHY